MLTSGYWQELSTRDFDRLDPEATVALLPVAAIEQHGPHLPLGTDALINAAVIARTLELLLPGPCLLVLPALTIGHSLEHSAYAGTLSGDAETLLAIWTQVGASVARSGVRRLILFNSHGGQSALVDLAALRLRAEHRLLVVRASTFALGVPQGLFERDELAHGLHGGEVETSLMLHLHPDLVRREALADFRGLAAQMAAAGGLIGPERPVGFGWMSQDLHPAGVCGNAARADAERGRLLLDYLAECLVRLVGEVVALPLGVLTSR